MRKQIVLVISIAPVSLATCTSLIANASPVPPGFFDHSPCPLEYNRIAAAKLSYLRLNSKIRLH
jgi:hypothetical protein